MPNRTILIGGAIALALIILGITGVLFNPKPRPAAPTRPTMETSGAATKAGAVASPTPQDK
jgi:hypothetical protein